MSRAPAAALAVFVFALGAPQARAQGTAIQHSPWTMYDAGIVGIPSPPQRHGDPSLYALAPPVPPPGSDWVALTGTPPDVRNPVDINYLGPNDDYSSNLRTCLTQAAFTYFETYLRIPPGTRINSAKIQVGPLDDGARVVIFNSLSPNGATPSGGYVLLGDTETSDLAAYLVAGEDNLVVIEYVDDCAAQGWLGTVELVVNGSGVTQATKSTGSWGELKARYR